MLYSWIVYLTFYHKIVKMIVWALQNINYTKYDI